MKTLLDLIDDYQRALAGVSDAPASSLTAEALRMSRQALLDAVAHNFGFRQVLEWARERASHLALSVPALVPGASPDVQACAARELLGLGVPSADHLLSWPLPCDVTVGRVTVKRGEPLQKLVSRAQALYQQVVTRREKSAANPPPLCDLTENEQYRQQMAGISTAALGYWKEGDSLHPDYDTPVLHQVAKLYADYVKARQEPPRNYVVPIAFRDIHDLVSAAYTAGRSAPDNPLMQRLGVPENAQAYTTRVLEKYHGRFSADPDRLPSTFAGWTLHRMDGNVIFIRGPGGYCVNLQPTAWGGSYEGMLYALADEVIGALPFEPLDLPKDRAPAEDLPEPGRIEVMSPTPENEAERLRGLLRMLAQRARSFPNFPMGYHLPEVFEAAGEDPPTPPTSSPPPCCCAENASRGMFVVRLKNMQQHGSPWLTVTSVLALLSDCDMLAQRGTL